MGVDFTVIKAFGFVIKASEFRTWVDETTERIKEEKRAKAEAKIESKKRKRGSGAAAGAKRQKTGAGSGAGAAAADDDEEEENDKEEWELEYSDFSEVSFGSFVAQDLYSDYEGD